MRSEDDLLDALDALDALASDCPRAHDVLPAVPARSARAHPAWLTPAAASLLVLAIAAGVAMSLGGSRRPPDASTRGLTGIHWTLKRIGAASAPGDLGLYVEPNGRLTQTIEYCTTLLASSDPRASRLLMLTDVQISPGLCPVVPPSTSSSRYASATLRRVLRGPVRWSVTAGRLTVARPGSPVLTYVHTPHTAARTRTFVYRGVGVVVPRSWVRDAEHCGSPTRDTVLFPVPVLYCKELHPAAVGAVRFEPYRAAIDPRSASRPWS